MRMFLFVALLVTCSFTAFAFNFQDVVESNRPDQTVDVDLDTPETKANERGDLIDRLFYEDEGKPDDFKSLGRKKRLATSIKGVLKRSRK